MSVTWQAMAEALAERCACRTARDLVSQLASLLGPHGGDVKGVMLVDGAGDDIGVPTVTCDRCGGSASWCAPKRCPSSRCCCAVRMAERPTV